MLGVIEHWSKYRTASYKTYAENWAKANSWRLYSNTTGRDQRNANWHDRMTAGYAYLRLLQAGSVGATVGDVALNLDAQLKLKLTPEREQLIDYVFPGQTKPSFSWKSVDSNFLGLPVWIEMGEHAGNTDYYDRARDIQNYQVKVMGLRDAKTGLWFQTEDAKTQKSPNGLPILWGRGNGWIAAGLANILSDLPKSRPEYATYLARYTDVVNAVRTRQRADGFWSMNLADPNHSPGPETSVTALLTYAIAKGIGLGILDRATYEPFAAKAWNGMVATSIASDGQLGFCQGVGGGPAPPPGHPAHPDENSTAEYNFCVGAFLLAGTAMSGIASANGATPVRTYQAESLPTTVSSGGSQVDVSNRYASGGRANSAKLATTSAFVEFKAANVPSGTYELVVEYRADETAGIWQLQTDGVDTGPRVDGYDVARHYAEVDLGSVTYTGSTSTRRLRFVVMGKSQLSSGYRIGIDAINLLDLASTR